MRWPFSKKNVTVYSKQMQKNDGALGFLINTVHTLRRQLGSGQGFGISPDGKRDYNTLFGYGVTLSYDDYYGMYRRGGAALTIVDKVAKACWRDVPTIKVGETEILKTELQTLRSSGFFKAMERADILNRIGNFSVLVVGVPDGEDLDQPLGSAGKNNFESMYFNPYSYDGIEIMQCDEEPSSSRFSLPLLYSVQISTTRTGQNKDTNTKSYIVHWSRIIHMAEGQLESAIEGKPALESPWNALTDKNKVSGSSSEAFYRNVKRLLALEADKDAQLDSEGPAKEKFEQDIEDFQNGFKDTLKLQSIKANVLQPGLASPRDAFDINMEEVSATTGIPMRIFGKVGGNTTGTEDKATWNALVKDRQDSDCTVWLMRGLKIMSESGMIDLPDNVTVEWPPMAALNELDASTVIEKKAKAVKDILDALSTLGASDVDPKSVFDAIGLRDIEIDNDDLDDTEDAEVV